MRWFLILSLVFAWVESGSAFQSVNDLYRSPSENKVILFLSSKCPCSCSHTEHLNQLHKKYHAKYEFWGVITESYSNSDLPWLRELYESEKFSFPIIWDPQQKLIQKYGALKTPHVTIVKGRGSKEEILYQGGVSSKSQFVADSTHYLEENLQALSTTHQVKFKNGRSLGCYIQRK